MPSITNLGMDSTSVKMNWARNAGKHSWKISRTSCSSQPRDLGVSNRASGMVTITSDASATTASAMDATGMERVTKSTTVNAATPATQRTACETPERYSLSICCSLPSYTSANASITLKANVPQQMVSISPA